VIVHQYLRDESIDSFSFFPHACLLLGPRTRTQQEGQEEEEEGEEPPPSLAL
jgi:hypothetical protein